MRTIFVITGTRPEAIKMAPLVRRLKENGNFRVTLCSTGQHREMIRQVFDLFSLTPDIDLDVMKPNQALPDLTGAILSGVDRLLGEHRPDCVLVHGDTTTTLAASLAAFYRKIPVGHVEAGLRTGDLYAPYPEEMNRKLTDAISDRLYAPTIAAQDNLLREGMNADRILVTGNTVIDALLDVVNGPLRDSNTQQALGERFPFLSRGGKLLLVTCHRRESFGEGFRHVCAALEQLAAREDLTIAFPVHLNPNVRSVFGKLGAFPRVKLMEPLNYLEFVFLMSKSDVILTDSGGIQEEAPALGKPVLVMRDVTERPEAVAAGTARLVGTNTEGIVEAVNAILDEKPPRDLSTIRNPYGDGRASERIIASLLEDMT
jgi:UDP-N-acetylglucosamine 2-epimerase (non-hydrolysing)